MGSPFQRVSFQDLKAKVGIDDVAYALGYRLDRRAGVGRYFEMVLVNGGQTRDKIIVKNTANKAAQTFFRRNGTHGDVVTLIQENLGAFHVASNNEWQQVTEVLSGFANMPVQSYRSELEQINSNRGGRPFQADRYEVQSVDCNNIPRLLSLRGFDNQTVKTFAPFISLISDRTNKNFNGFNIGFPYTSLCQDGIVGYEIRGFGGFKSKAAGTNSTSAAWIADMSDDRKMVENVFVFESAFDAMAFYQINRLRLGSNVAFVSLGGSFSDNQVLSVMDHFPNARLTDCFDNDIPGRVNGLRMLSVIENVPVKIQKGEEGVNVRIKDKSIDLLFDRPLYAELGDHVALRHKMSQWLPPKGFKDWNDCLLGKNMTMEFSKSKEERNECLAERRKKSLAL